MANTFKNVTFQGGAVAADVVSPVGTACPDGSQITIIGMTIANLVSDVISVGVKMTDNHSSPTTTWIVKDAPIPVGSALELMAGNKVVLEVDAQITIDCSVADKLSGTLSIMEIT